MTAHSIFPPSSMHRLVNCPGSFELAKLYPEREDSPASMEGTAAHWVCAELLHGRRVEVGTLAPNGIAVTDEMIEGAEMYVSTVPPEMIGPTMLCHVEEKIEIPRIHEQCFGTPDLWWFGKQTIHLSDYKFGHEYVEVIENDQLIAYAAGILDYLNVPDQRTYVNFTIVQPRCFTGSGPIRTWTCLASDLRARINIMNGAAAKALMGGAECVAGAWCHHCTAVHACEAAHRARGSMIDFTAFPVPADIPVESKALYLDRVKQAAVLLKAIESGMEEEIEALIRSGVSVPGYELRPGQGRTVWSKPNAEIAALGEMLGANFRKDAMVTPKQARDMLKKLGIDGSVIDAYSAESSGALKLAQTDMRKLKQVFQLNNHKEQ